MPGFGTSNRTYENVKKISAALKISLDEIDIRDACEKQFNDINHNIENHNIVYENVQARQRTLTLMNIANKIGGLVIGTGDLSEIALGWSTYNGDHISMYNVNCGVPKTLVKFLIQWVAETQTNGAAKTALSDILNTPISPELLPTDSAGKISQKTEDKIGPYELHDFFLYHFVRYNATPEKIIFLAKHAFKNKYNSNTIKKWLNVFIKKFFAAQFKRSCVPDGPKVGSVSLSPRGDWRMPSDASAEIWINNLTHN
jgi:NAD+ synthase (glutamine-hydrolysing)